MSSAANAVPTAVPAATILMLRDGVEALEVFMVVRHHQIDFASGALVFPGGKVDAGDSAVRDRCHGVDDADDVALSLQAGAIREAFEECGILLAREQGSTALVSAASVFHWRSSSRSNEFPRSAASAASSPRPFQPPLSGR